MQTITIAEPETMEFPKLMVKPTTGDIYWCVNDKNAHMVQGDAGIKILTATTGLTDFVGTVTIDQSFDFESLFSEV